MRQKSLVQHNALEIARLRAEVRETLKHRDDDATSRELWRAACEAFHANYDLLAFPGGMRTARDRLREGDPEAVEYALQFLEVRPYFFRSGFMYKDFLRVLRNCPLSTEQRERYDGIREAYLRYRESRRNPKPENESSRSC